MTAQVLSRGLPADAGAGSPEEPLALYIHWPFCVSKCPYCDFNSHVRDSVNQPLWRDALLADLAHEAALTRGYGLGSIFFGGGTPSLMPSATVEALIDSAAGHWSFMSDIEITLEANPSSVEAGRFADLAQAGVNRLSLGLQSLEDEALRFLGRTHDVAEELAALDVAQARFRRVSFDLIYALPGQTEQAWRNELERALGFGMGHLSLYQLTIEPGTRFAALAAKGELAGVDMDHAARLFELTQALTANAGLPRYEISNHARPGEESRHNLAYWRYQPYCGIGPGAHGRRNGRFTQRHKKPENWIAALERSGHGIEAEATLSAKDRAAEALLMGLRLSEGVDLERIAGLSGRPIDRLIDRHRADLLGREGLLEADGSRLRITSSGALLLNSILAEIVQVD